MADEEQENPQQKNELTEEELGDIVPPSELAFEKFSDENRPDHLTTYSPEHRVTIVKSDEEFEAIVKKAGEGLVVVFFAVGWSESCEIIRAEYADLSIDYQNVVFLEMDCDHFFELHKKEYPNDFNYFYFYRNVEHLPAFHFYNYFGGGASKLDEFVPRIVNGGNRYKLEEYIQRHGGMDSLKPYLKS